MKSICSLLVNIAIFSVVFSLTEYNVSGFCVYLRLKFNFFFTKKYFQLEQSQVKQKENISETFVLSSKFLQQMKPQNSCSQIGKIVAVLELETTVGLF